MRALEGRRPGRVDGRKRRACGRARCGQCGRHDRRVGCVRARRRRAETLPQRGCRRAAALAAHAAQYRRRKHGDDRRALREAGIAAERVARHAVEQGKECCDCCERKQRLEPRCPDDAPWAFTDAGNGSDTNSRHRSSFAATLVRVVHRNRAMLRCNVCARAFDRTTRGRSQTSAQRLPAAFG